MNETDETRFNYALGSLQDAVRVASDTMEDAERAFEALGGILYGFSTCDGVPREVDLAWLSDKAEDEARKLRAACEALDGATAVEQMA